MFDWVKRFFNPEATGDAPIEIERSMLDQIERRIQRVGGGKKVFPFTTIDVEIYPKDAESASDLSSLAPRWGLQDQIKRFLEEHDVEHGDFAFNLTVAGAGDRPADDIACTVACRSHNTGATVQTGSGNGGDIEIEVLEGNATERVYRFYGRKRINLGRLEEPTDARGRPTHRNHVAFLEDEIGGTVSRSHGEIILASDGTWRIKDSSNGGTVVLRKDERIKVSSRDLRGFPLVDGDEIMLGKARIRIAFAQGARA